MTQVFLIKSEDHAEGIAANKEKRQPLLKGN